MRPQVITMRSTDFGWLSDEGLLEWLTGRDRRPNLMIVAHGKALEEVADRVMAVCKAPILPSVFPGRLHLPTSHRGTVLLQNVNQMSIPQQIVLNDWIDDARGDAQIVSISPTSVWRLVQNGEFLEGLFYRLSVIRLDAAASWPAAQTEETGGCYDLPQA
jgi:hypothetical protein